MATNKRIPVPIARRLSLMTSRILVVVVWLGACTLLYSISQERQGRIQAMGMIDAREWLISARDDTMIEGLAVDVFDTVQEGDILVTLDDTEYRAELALIQSELALAQAQLAREAHMLDLEQQRTHNEALADRRRLLVDYEEARLDHLERQVQQEVARVELQRLEADLERTRTLVHRGVTGEAQLSDLELEVEALRQQIARSEELIEVSAAQLEEIRNRQEWIEGREDQTASLDLLKPFRAEIDAKQTLINNMLADERRFVLKSPTNGVVNAVYRRPGETAVLGEPIVTIADPKSSRIIVYLDENQAGRVSPGDPAFIQSLDFMGPEVNSSIIKVGPTVSEIPVQLRRQQNVNILEWGVPALVQLPPDLPYAPGRRVWISIQSS